MCESLKLNFFFFSWSRCKQLEKRSVFNNQHNEGWEKANMKILSVSEERQIIPVVLVYGDYIVILFLVKLVFVFCAFFPFCVVVVWSGVSGLVPVLSIVYFNVDMRNHWLFSIGFSLLKLDILFTYDMPI